MLLNLKQPANPNAYNPGTYDVKRVFNTPSHVTEIIKVENDEKKIINLKYIIDKKPPVKIVREYMRKQINSIQSDELELFSFDL